MLTHYLKEAGLIVVNVTNCEEARKQLKLQKPDLVVLDVILPGQSGFELCHELKVNSSTERIPIVICSTKGSDADKLWGKMLGADAYLQKPVNPHELISTLQQFITV
ncbi:MAG: response regulator [Elainellaceae cyanobacterium]